MSTERISVEAAIYDEFVDRIVSNVGRCGWASTARTSVPNLAR
ncbi:hypothetical protein ACQP0C_22410 [Nocardia sp. CA-129566]